MFVVFVGDNADLDAVDAEVVDFVAEFHQVDSSNCMEQTSGTNGGKDLNHKHHLSRLTQCRLTKSGK